MSTECRDPNWNSDGGFGKYEIFDFCDEGLLVWDGTVPALKVNFYQNNELQTTLANRMLCLSFDSIVAYDLNGNSSYSMPIIYVDYCIGESPFKKYYYRDKETLILLNNGTIVDAKLQNSEESK